MNPFFPLRSRTGSHDLDAATDAGAVHLEPTPKRHHHRRGRQPLSPVIAIHCRRPRGCRCCRRRGGLTTHESFFGVGHRRHDEGDGAARRRGRNEEGWQGARRPGPLLTLPRRKPSCRLTRCAGSPAAATYLHHVGTLRPPPAFAASGPPRPPPVFVVPETHGRYLSRRTREQEGPRPPPRRPSTRARASLPRTPETCRRLIRRVGWRWEGVAVAALLDGEVEGDEAAGESSARRAPADGARALAMGE
ncbi:hypothetical protein DAI22_04g028450 [Oryza sativa Japonica Group]|nr:hypothetical protein DAI22_04g028450 [Oryza sativa Japonica Group]